MDEDLLNDDDVAGAVEVAIATGFRLMNRLPHDHRAAQWVEVQSHLNQALLALRDGMAS